MPIARIFESLRQGAIAGFQSHRGLDPFLSFARAQAETLHHAHHFRGLSRKLLDRAGCRRRGGLAYLLEGLSY